MADLPRIKGNIQKMIAQGAPEADIDAYVAGEGVTPEVLRGDSRGIIDKLTGRDGGERYQTWPEKLLRGVGESALSGATLPGDVMAGKAPVPSSENGGEGIGRVMDLAALATPVNPGVRAGDRAIPGVTKALRAEKPVVPSAQELKAAGGADIQAAQSSDLRIPAQAVADYSRQMQRELLGPGSSIHPVDAPATFTKLKELEGAPADAFFTPSNLQSLRESLQATAQNFNPAASKDQLAASRAIRQLDQLLSSLGPKDTMAGPTSAGLATREQLVSSAMDGQREAGRVAGLFDRGRGNYAAAQRSNDVMGTLDRARTGIIERAEGRAQAANSGRNLDNQIRQKVEAVLEKPKELSGLTDSEVTALEGVVDGGRARNTARYVGNALAGGGGVAQTGFGMAGAGFGGAVGGVPGAIVGAAVPTAIGAVSRSVANALAKRALSKVDETLRKRSPLYQERVDHPKMSAVSPAKRSALIRALMLSSDDQR